MARTALVTGGAQGIGKCIALTLAAQGYRVVILDIDREAGEETASEIPGVRFLHGDVAREPDVHAGVEAAAAEMGGLDVLVSNACAGVWKPVTELTLAEWDRVLAVGLGGVFLCAKHAAPFLKARRGSIVNIASTRAFMSEPNGESYGAAKGGVIALTHALAVSLGPEVRVNCIAPGWIEVGTWKKKSARTAPRHSDADRLQHPAGRVGRPEDIADLVAFLASEKAGFVTGTTFTVDGGMTKKMIYV
jgi:NAD(P)-dependent dehydrogenase (short-subunit alcohol dehydrogenase family)